MPPSASTAIPEARRRRPVADEPRLSLVVLDLHQRCDGGRTAQGNRGFRHPHPEAARQGLPQARQHADLPGPRPAARPAEVIDAARRLLALRSIDDDKTTKKQLSDEQLKDLADRLKEAEARLPAALMTAYRLHPGARREEDDPLPRHGHLGVQRQARP